MKVPVSVKFSLALGGMAFAFCAIATGSLYAVLCGVEALEPGVESALYVVVIPSAVIGILLSGICFATSPKEPEIITIL